MFAATTFGDVELAGLLAVALAIAMGLVKILERSFDALVRKKEPEAGNGLPYFRASDRQSLQEVKGVVCRTDAFGRPLVYQAADILDVLKRQAALLERMNDITDEELQAKKDRIAVCNRHTKTMDEIKKKLEV